MAGHNKWSKVKRSKGVLDQKRGQLFSRLAKEITISAKIAGADPAANPRLRTAILSARAQSMPNENIERAIKRALGESNGGGGLQELIYEGYAPGGVAVLMEAATDNKNRTAADLRLLFSKNHGSLASNGSVAYLFKRRGQIALPRATFAEDRLFEIALEAGAEDVRTDDEHHLVITAHDQLYAVADSLIKAGLEPESQKLVYFPDTSVHISDRTVAAQIIRLLDALEENDDVQAVHANFDAPEEIFARSSG
ncbi:MAG: YebC/PmpR family DNA-binding transcriptional regulator [Verrucomicrobiota bacterium]|nr:YebC/PmpR family DNA-binding transcriptional regulator [Verrucomicrobiota bacterium]